MRRAFHNGASTNFGRPRAPARGRAVVNGTRKRFWPSGFHPWRARSPWQIKLTGDCILAENHKTLDRNQKNRQAWPMRGQIRAASYLQFFGRNETPE